MYPYLLALHIIFVVTWFSGLFYIVRLFIYAREAQDKGKYEMVEQFKIMSKRLWLGITWPSAILTLILGPLVMWQGGWLEKFSQHKWLHIKLLFVILLYLYFYSLHRIYKQQQKGIFKLSSQMLRIWNEVATLFLIVIVMLAVVKNTMSWVWGLIGLVFVMIVLLLATIIYKKIRSK